MRDFAMYPAAPATRACSASAVCSEPLTEREALRSTGIVVNCPIVARLL